MSARSTGGIAQEAYVKLPIVRTIATRTATAVGAAVISAVVVAGSLSVAQAATEAIAPDSITSTMIRDGAVKSVDIRDGAVTGADLADGSVTGADLTDNSVSGVDVANGSLGILDIGNNAIDGLHVRNGSLSGADIQNGSIGGNNIADGSISSADVDASVGRPRVSVYVDGSATVGELTTARATGVESVTNPNSGLFCITPVAGVDVDAVVPIVSRTFSGTAFPFEVTVGWTDFRYECPSTSIAVFATTADFSVNDVGFTVVIP